MKLFKNIFLLIALVAVDSLSARTFGGIRPTQQPAPTSVPTPQPTPAPTPVPTTRAQSFQEHLEMVRRSTSAQVINDQGIFTPEFEKFVKDSNLAPELMEALLEAGRSLHLPLSGKNDRSDLNLVDYSQDKIDFFMKNYAAPSAATQLTMSEQEFYNTGTRLFREDFLNRKVKELMGDMDQKNVEIFLIKELMPLITNVWKKRGILKEMTPEPARNQIKRAVENEFRKWKPTPQYKKLSPQEQAERYERYIKNAFSKLTLNQVNTEFINNISEELRYKFNITDKTYLVTLITNGLVERFPNDTTARKMKIETVGRIIFGQKIQPPVPKPMPQPQPSPEAAAPAALPAPQPAQPQPMPQPQKTTLINKQANEQIEDFVLRLVNQNKQQIISLFFEEKSGILTFSPKDSNAAQILVSDLYNNIKKEYSNMSVDKIIQNLSLAIAIAEFLPVNVNVQGLNEFINATLE